jgi:DNA-binding transcriptional LysR family regulator
MVTPLASVKLDTLYHFHHIAQQRSLKKAALSLHLTPPSLTHSLAKLEAALGCTLCLRSRSGFRLTEAGRRLFAATEAIFARLGETLDSLRDSDDFEGVLNLGLLDGLHGGAVDEALFAMMRRYPACRLNLRVTDPDDINRLLYHGDLDAGIGIFYARLDALTYIPAETETLAYYISDRHELWPRARIGREHLFGREVAWLDVEKRDNFALETEVFGSHPGYKMTVTAYSNSVMGGIRILLSGKAVVPLPVKFMRRFLAGGETRIRRLDVKTKAPALLIECAYNPRRPVVAPVRFLVERFAAGAAKIVPPPEGFTNRPRVSGEARRSRR